MFFVLFRPWFWGKLTPDAPLGSISRWTLLVQCFVWSFAISLFVFVFEGLLILAQGYMTFLHCGVYYLLPAVLETHRNLYSETTLTILQLGIPTVACLLGGFAAFLWEWSRRRKQSGVKPQHLAPAKRALFLMYSYLICS